MVEFTKKFIKKDALMDLGIAIATLFISNLIVIIIPSFFLLGTKVVFDELFFKNLFYWALLVGTLPIYFSSKIYAYIIKVTNPDKPIYFDTRINDFEEGLLFQLSKVKGFNFLLLLKNPLRQLMIGFLVFVPVGLVNMIKKTWLTALPPFEQQALTTGQKLYFDIEPAGGSETMTFALIIGWIMVLMKALQLKYKFSKLTYWLLTTPLCLFVGVTGWILYHLGRYGADDVALQFAGTFSFIGTFTMLLFGGFIVWWEFHDILNFFHSLISKGIASSEAVLSSAIAIYLLVLVFYILIEFQLAKRRKKRITIQDV